MTVRTAIGFFVILLACGAATGCSDEKSPAVEAAQKVEKAAETAAENFERSAENMKEAYEEKRAEGEGRVEAAGDAYNEMLDEDGLE